jgi:hypothetical protein
MNKDACLLVAGLTFGLVVALQSGCAGTATVTQPTAKTAPVQKEAVKPALKETKPAEELILAGKVVETMNSGGYTYISLEKDGKKGWVAVPATQVAVGQEVQVKPGMEMGKFASKTLNRTFENILFSSGLVADTKVSLPSTPLTSDPKSSLPPGHPPMDAKPQIDQGQPAPDAKALPKDQKGMMGMMAQTGNEMVAVSGKVVETMDSGGYTYICLESGGKNIWAAVPTMKVSVGQELKLQPGQEMSNFKSKSLNRTFDSVIFSGGALPAAK